MIILLSYPIQFRPIDFNNKKMIENNSNTKRPMKK